MDWLRSCYVSKWRLFRESDRLTRGFYYFDPHDVPKFLDVPNYYGSSNWTTTEREVESDGLGEVYPQPVPDRPWRNGSFAGPIPEQVSLGDPDCFERGDVLAEGDEFSTTYDGISSRLLRRYQTDLFGPGLAVWLSAQTLIYGPPPHTSFSWPDQSGLGRTPVSITPNGYEVRIDTPPGWFPRKASPGDLQWRYDVETVFRCGEFLSIYIAGNFGRWSVFNEHMGSVSLTGFQTYLELAPAFWQWQSPNGISADVPSQSDQPFHAVVTRAGRTFKIEVNGYVVGPLTVHPDLDLQCCEFAYLSTLQTPPGFTPTPLTTQPGFSEVLMFDRILDPVYHDLVMAYLREEYPI